MSTAYDETVRQAAKVLHIEGLSSREIRERLKDGTAGLSFQAEPSERTIDKWRRVWKDEGVIAQFSIRLGEEEAVEEAIYRQFLGMARYSMKVINDRIVDGTATTREVSQISAILKTIDHAKYQRQLRAKAKSRKLTPAEGGYMGSGGASVSTESTLERIAREEREFREQVQA